MSHSPPVSTEAEEAADTGFETLRTTDGEQATAQTRSRTMTEKGREFAVTTTRKSAIAQEKEFRRKLNSLNTLISESRDQDRIKRELQTMTVLVDNTLDKFSAWSNLIEDPVEWRSISDMRSVAQDVWESAQRTAWQRIQFLEDEEVRSTASRLSRGSGHSRRSTESNLSSKETLVNIKAKRAALQQKIRFCDAIKEQERALEKLRLEQELNEAVAEEEIYQTAVREEESPSSRLPLESLNVLNYYLQDQGAPHRSSLTEQLPVSTTTHTLRSTTSPLTSNLTFAQHRPEASHTSTFLTTPVSSTSPNTAVNNPYTSIQQHVESTNTTFTLAQPRPTVTPISTAETQPDTQGFPDHRAHVFTPMRPQLPMDNAQQIAETLTKVTQLQRLPQAKPDVYKGDEKDKTRFFLWETAFDALVDSAPVSSQQKLHLLYQHLDGKAKRVVEQLQFMIGDPGKAYQEARKKLKERFGHSAVLSVEFENKLSNWPKIGINDAEGIQQFGDFLQQVEIVSKYISNLKIFEFPSKLQSLVEKLPGWFRSKWSSKVQKLQQTKGHEAFPSFADFVAEVTFHAERMNIPQIAYAGVTGSPNPTSGPACRRIRGSSVTTLASNAARAQGEPNIYGRGHKERIASQTTSHNQQRNSTAGEVFCPYHKTKSHVLNECQKFQELGFPQRKDFLSRNRVCFNCANSDQHTARVCDQGQPECRICHKNHVTVLHDPTKHCSSNISSDTSTQSTSACTQICGEGMSRSCAKIVLVKVHHQSDPSIEMLTYAVLDDQSTDVFVTDSLLDKLAVEGNEVNTIVGTKTIRTRKISGLRIQDVENIHPPIKVPFAYAQESISATHFDIATPEVAKQWQHLKGIADKIHHQPDVKIGMLIGRNVPTAFQPISVIYGGSDEPWAEEYKFGWTVIGRVCQDNSNQHTAIVNRVTVQRENLTDYDPKAAPTIATSNVLQDSGAITFFTSKSQTKDVTSPRQLREMMELDYSELHHSRKIRGTEQTESVQDRHFNHILRTGLHKDARGNWEAPLPFKIDNMSLPNNKEHCLRRLLSLKRKLVKNEKAKKDYIEFMQKNFDRGHASQIPHDELHTAPGEVWYLPHFDVYHPKKPDQIRVVFDCSAIFESDSLNKHLLQGPDMLNALIGVLTRFRKEEVAFTCDIEQMFHSFRVNPEHRNYLRFLWFKDNNLNGPIVECRMNVHLFGAVSSPGVANFCLRETAEAGREQHGDEAADFLCEDFYVDDGLKSLPTVEDAIKVIMSSQTMCAATRLRLHKFASNKKEVLEALPVEDRASDLKDLDFRLDELPIQRSLGTYWCMESDTLGFHIDLKDKPLSRQGILSTVSSVYDPLGIVAPVILVGKQILQELCRRNTDWDDPVPEDISARW